MQIDDDNRKWHLNVGGPRGWTTACGIESSSFIDAHKHDEHFMIDCKRCLAAMKPAQLRPGMYAGPQGNRDEDEWKAAAVEAYFDRSKPTVQMA